MTLDAKSSNGDTMQEPFTRLRRDLTIPNPSPAWPPGLTLSSFAERERTVEAHDVLRTAFEDGGGSVAATCDGWWRSVSGDDEYDPSLFFVVSTAADRIVAVAHCWRVPFVKDLVVARDWRRRGVAEALLLHVFDVFRSRGCRSCDLKVLHDNPSGAERLYRRLGMRDVGAAEEGQGLCP